MAAISPNVSSDPQLGTGSKTDFAFNFSIVAATDIGVYVDGVRKSHPSDYTVIFGDVSGTVTFTSPPPNGAEILLVSEPDYLQTSEFADQGAYNLSTVNTINRRAAVKALVLKDGFDRALKFPRGTAAPDLPALQDGEDRVLGYSPKGFVWAPSDTVTVAADLIRAEAAADTAAAAALAASGDRTAIAALLAFQARRAAKPLDTSAISSTALISDADLTVPLGANSLMILRGHINFSASAAGDIKWQHSGPASPASVQVNRRALAAGASAFSGIAVDTAYSSGDIAIDGGTGSGSIEFDATIRNGPTAGSFAFKWAQNTSDATATIVKAGSYIEYIPLQTAATFAFSSTAIAKLGDFTGPTLSGGHNVILMIETSGISNSYVETIITGTAADAQLFAGSYTITVDGVPSTVTAPAGWSYVPLFAGLADTPHRVRIKGNATGGNNAIDSDILIRVSGNAPNIARPTDIPNYYRIFDAAYTSYISKDGAPNTFTGTYTAAPALAYVSTACAEGHRFSATTTSVRAWLYDATGASKVEILQDGLSIGVITMPGSGNMERVTLATGLSGTHDYEIRPIDSGRYFYCFSILADALTASTHANKNLYAWYGDSNTQMLVGEDARTHASFLLAKRRGWANVRRGVGGQMVSTWGRDNTALVTSGLSQPANVIINMLGVNDYYFGTALANFQADYITMLANQRSGNASAPIVCLGIHDHYRATAAGAAYSDTVRASYNARIQAAVGARAIAGDANVFYLDTTGWINPAAIPAPLRDAVHLNATGWIAFEAALNTALLGLGL